MEEYCISVSIGLELLLGLLHTHMHLTHFGFSLTHFPSLPLLSLMNVGISSVRLATGEGRGQLSVNQTHPC